MPANLISSGHVETAALCQNKGRNIISLKILMPFATMELMTAVLLTEMLRTRRQCHSSLQETSR